MLATLIVGIVVLLFGLSAQTWVIFGALQKQGTDLRSEIGALRTELLTDQARFKTEVREEIRINAGLVLTQVETVRNDLAFLRIDVAKIGQRLDDHIAHHPPA